MEQAITTATTTPDFGKLPSGERFGLVPAWALKLGGVSPGPKALYASFCTNADEHGQMWRVLPAVYTFLAQDHRFEASSSRAMTLATEAPAE